MDQKEKIENFEIDNPEDLETENIKQCHFLAKIIIGLVVIIVFQIIFLLVTHSNIKETNSNISNVNLKKYMIDDGNKKLDRTLNEDFKTDFAYDEETEKKDNEIKSKEKLIKDYKHKIRKIQRNLNNSQPIEEILEINGEKMKKLNERKASLEEKISDFRKQFNSKILDSFNEFYDLKSLIKENIYKNEARGLELSLVYSYENWQGEFNYDEATYPINFNENKAYVLIFQTNIFGRYGVVLTFETNGRYLVFDLNNKNMHNVFESDMMKFVFNRQNLKLLLTNIKEYSFHKKNKELDYDKVTNITHFEIYKIY